MSKAIHISNQNNFKSYMPYKAITNSGSKQFQLQQIAITGSNGIRIINVNATPNDKDSIYSVWGITQTNNSQSSKLIQVVEADKDGSVTQNGVMDNGDLYKQGDVENTLTWADGTEVNFVIEVVSVDANTAKVSITFKK